MIEENKFRGFGDEMAKAIHKSKSFEAPAVLTLILYYVGFYIIGFIVNLLYISSANKSMRIAGESPPLLIYSYKILL